MSHNCFTEYLISLFHKKDIKKFDIAEFGVGMANNINYLSNFVNIIDGYDGSKKSINEVFLLNQRNKNINGKLVNLGSFFDGLRMYNIIIYGFFTYMITDKEFTILVENTKKLLKQDGYIFIYDFISKKT